MSAMPRPSIAESAGERAPRARFAGMRTLGARLRHEWRLAPWPVRIAVICLLTFYVFAAVSPVIAPYDPAYQYRNLPDCAPMRLHVSPLSEWGHGFFYVYPKRMVDPLARRFVEERNHRIYVRLF